MTVTFADWRWLMSLDKSAPCSAKDGGHATKPAAMTRPFDAEYHLRADSEIRKTIISPCNTIVEARTKARPEVPRSDKLLAS
jgi:hypothetical protein